ncbi:MAG: tetratricopeptide repeat protein [Deltaproteobacteria bacterium]|nr:tetratricopeptide repeat protein [Deltaproteobacteria bacterium]
MKPRALLLSATGALALFACHVQIGSAPGAPASPPAAPPNGAAPSPPPARAGSASPAKVAQRVGRIATSSPPVAPAPTPSPPPPIQASRAPAIEEVAQVAGDLGAPPSATEARPATRRSPGKLASPLVSRAPSIVGSADVAAQRESLAFYASEETKASPALRTDLQSLRATIARERRTYQVGVTAVSGKPLARITGGREPTIDVAAANQMAASRASLRTKSNLLSRDLESGAALPPRLGTQENARMNADDVRSEPSEPSGGGSPMAPSFSWRDRMTPIKDQGDCGSCWAFATVAALEALESIHNGRRGLDLAEQHLVNCAPNPFQPDNCEGNSASAVWKWLLENASAPESSVPYRGRMLSCARSAGTAGPKIEAWGFAGSGRSATVEQIKEAMVAHGPIVANVNSTRSFQHYTGGVFDDRDNGTTNHLIVLVGWDDRKGAWLLRNSWSSKWGEGGYMWIKYGSNAVGSWATWAEPVRTTPPRPTFSDRYVSLTNDSGEPLVVFVQAETVDGGAPRWVPATPGAGAASFRFDLPAGATLDVKRPDTGRFLTAKRARIRATSTDGRRTWTDFESRDWMIAAAPYEAATRERSTFTFGRPDAKPKAADELFTEATSARKASDWPRAGALYKDFVGRFPSDPRAHSGRFYLGYAQYKQRQYDPATTTFSSTIKSAPRGHATIPLGFYYLGLSEAAQGDCGRAAKAFQMVAYGELDAPAEWVAAAKKNLFTLFEDDGTICASWD